MYPSETAACHSAPYDPFWTFLNLICWRNFALLRTPNNIKFRIGQLKQILGTFVRKKKIIPFCRSKVFVLLSKFQSSCTLLGCEQRFLLPSQRSPTFVFYKPQDSVFSPNMAFACLLSWKLSCMVKFPLLYLALFRILLAASLGISVFPFFSWGPFHYPTFRFLQLFGNLFNSQASWSEYRRLGSQVAELFSINRVIFHDIHKTEGRLWAIQDTKYDKYLAGKYKRACTPLAGKCKNWIFQ